MKRVFKSTQCKIAIACLTLSLSGAVLANPNPNPNSNSVSPTSQPAKSGMDQHHKPGMPHFLRGLQLSEEQQNKVREIMHTQSPAVHASMKASRRAMANLHHITTNGNFDEKQAQAYANNAGKAHSRMIFLRAQEHAQIFALLTPEQRKQWEERRAQRPHHHHPKK